MKIKDHGHCVFWSVDTVWSSWINHIPFRSNSKQEFPGFWRLYTWLVTWSNSLLRSWVLTWDASIMPPGFIILSQHATWIRRKECWNSAIYPTIAVPAYDVFEGPASLGHSKLSDVQLTVHHPGDNSTSSHKYGSVYRFVTTDVPGHAVVDVIIFLRVLSCWWQWAVEN